MQVGYARVSTSEQSLAVQLDALQRHGCTKIFQEVASGAQAERQGLTAALAYVRPGDTLVVWRLDRLGRSLGQLIILMNTLHQQQIGFQSVVEAIDTTTATGQFFFQITGRLPNSNAISCGRGPWQDWPVRDGGAGKVDGAKPSSPRRLRWRCSSTQPARARYTVSVRAWALHGAPFIVIWPRIGHSRRSKSQ